MAPELLNLIDHNFMVKDGLNGPFADANEGSEDVSLERISRLLIERGDYPAVPIDFVYPCSLVTGWSQWVDHELRDETVRERLSRAGVLSAVFISSRCHVHRDVETLRHVLRRWNPHTHTFVCAWGEFTPTLEDVFNITRLPITGTMNPFNFTLDNAQNEKLKIIVEGASSKKENKRRFVNWVKHFWGVMKDGVLIPGEGFDSGCRLEAMLALWLTKYVFIEFSEGLVERRVYRLAVAIAAGHKFPLAPLFLGHVYRLLDLVVADELESAGQRGITTMVSTMFLQAFIWERFKCLEVKPLTPRSSMKLYKNDIIGSSGTYLPPKLPLLCRWFKKKQDKKVFCPMMLDNPDNFTWQPYIERHGFESFSFLGRKEQCGTSLGRVELYLTNLTNFIPSFGEDKGALTFNPVVYSPDRVIRQLGCPQEIPSRPPLSIKVIGMARKFSPREVECVLNFSGRLIDIPSQLPGLILHPAASSDYSRYWKGVLHRFRLFVEIGSPKMEFKPFTSSRLACHTAVLNYARRHNLPYTEVYDDGTRKIVGQLKDSKSSFWVAASTPQAGSAPNQVERANASIPKAKKGLKRKSELDIPLRRSNRIKLIRSPAFFGPPVCIELSDTEDEHGEDSKQDRTDSSDKTDGDESPNGEDDDERMSNSDETNRDESMCGDEESMSGSNESDGNQTMSDGGGMSNGGIGDVTRRNDGNNLSNGDQVDIRTDEPEHGSPYESDKQEQDHPLEVIGARIMDTAASQLNEQDNIGTGMMETTTDRLSEQLTTDALTIVSPEKLNVLEQSSDNIVTTIVVPPSKHVLADDHLVSNKVQSHDSSFPARGHVHEWVARMDDFATRFHSEVESSLSMDDIAPQLSEDTAEFQGMRVSLELVGPLTKFSEKYCEGKFLSLVNRGYTSKKMNKLTQEFGVMLLSMEVHQLKNEETFLVWRDACRDFMEAGFNVGFLLNSLKQAAQQYFGYMLRPAGSDHLYARVRTLQTTILQTKRELARLEEELGKTESDLGFAQPDVPASAVECALESSWEDNSRVAHFLY